MSMLSLATSSVLQDAVSLVLVTGAISDLHRQSVNDRVDDVIRLGITAENTGV